MSEKEDQGFNWDEDQLKAEEELEVVFTLTEELIKQNKDGDCELFIPA